MAAQRRVLLLGHDFGAPRRVPGADQLGVGQVLREPDPALTQRDRMGEDPADAGEGRSRQRHDRVVDRMEDLMRQVERAVTERLVKQVVGGGDRPDEGVFDRQAADLGAALANCRHHVLHVTAGQGFQVRPAAPGRGFAERSVRTLNGYTHEDAPK